MRAGNTMAFSCSIQFLLMVDLFGSVFFVILFYKFDSMTSVGTGRKVHFSLFGGFLVGFRWEVGLLCEWEIECLSVTFPQNLWPGQIPVLKKRYVFKNVFKKF